VEGARDGTRNSGGEIERGRAILLLRQPPPNRFTPVSRWTHTHTHTDRQTDRQTHVYGAETDARRSSVPIIKQRARTRTIDFCDPFPGEGGNAMKKERLRTGLRLVRARAPLFEACRRGAAPRLQNSEFRVEKPIS
jgi:hypothetical protein